MAELLLLLFVMAAAGLAIAWPVLDREASATTPARDDVGAAAIRHRLALEALRDIEADHRAGSLDEDTYAARRAEAEAWAVQTLEPEAGPDVPARSDAAGARRTAAVLGAVLAAALLVGFAAPAPFGVAERTLTDQALADARAADEARRAEIDRLLGELEEDPRNTETLSALADAYLAGSGSQDQQRGAVALIALLALDPDNASAYRRLITAYFNAGDWTDARSALDAYERVARHDEPDIPFFRGLLALRVDDDPDEAIRQFDRFLELAPHDPRAGMVLSLREQAAAED